MRRAVGPLRPAAEVLAAAKRAGELLAARSTAEEAEFVGPRPSEVKGNPSENDVDDPLSIAPAFDPVEVARGELAEKKRLAEARPDSGHEEWMTELPPELSILGGLLPDRPSGWEDAMPLMSTAEDSLA